MLELAEQGKVQFKERITDNYDIGCEMCAFSNTKGGKLLVGVKDKTGAINPLSYKEVQETTNRLSNIASENVVPAIRIDIENVKMDGGVIIVVDIFKGKDKPYQDNKGVIWMKNGADKRRVFEKAEIAALLLFGKYPQRFLPTFTAKCISFWGNSVGGTEFRDKVHDADMEGNLKHQYDTIMSFFTRNLRRVQVEKDFNTLGEVEVSLSALGEFVSNTLVHRSLNWRAPARFFIFDNRIEIHSPGSLPNDMTVEDVTSGVSMPRNNFLFQNAVYLLPYTGAGSGVVRAMETCPEAVFENKENIHEFIVTISRKSNQAGREIIQETEELSKKAIQVESKLSKKTIQEKLTPKQIDTLNFCSVPRSAQEIMDRLGLSNQNYNRQRNIGTLLELGFLEMTDPEHPKSRTQKYRKKV